MLNNNSGIISKNLDCGKICKIVTSFFNKEFQGEKKK